MNYGNKDNLVGALIIGGYDAQGGGQVRERENEREGEHPHPLIDKCREKAWHTSVWLHHTLLNIECLNQVFGCPIGGTLAREKWAIDGSGSTYIWGYCDAEFR